MTKVITVPLDTGITAQVQALPFIFEVLSVPFELAVHYAVDEPPGAMSVTHVGSGMRVARLRAEAVTDINDPAAWVTAARDAFERVVLRVTPETVLAGLMTQASI